MNELINACDMADECPYVAAARAEVEALKAERDSWRRTRETITGERDRAAAAANGLAGLLERRIPPPDIVGGMTIEDEDDHEARAAIARWRKGER